MNCKKQLKLSLKIQNPAKFDRMATLPPQGSANKTSMSNFKLSIFLEEPLMPSNFTDIYEIREKIGEVAIFYE